MGVYIKGMKMPENCHECEFVDILPTCPCNKMADDDFWNNVSLAVEGHKDCPLSKVETPHGRLIDGDKVLEIAMEWCPDDDGTVGKIGDLRELLDEIEAMPTIIEAEE